MKAKKVLAMLMASAMIMGTSVTTFAAAPDGEIQITLPEGAQDADLSYVQIITEDRESPIGWKFVNDTIEQAFVNAWLGRDQETVLGESDADTVINALFDIAEKTTTDDGDVYNPNANAIAGDIHSSAELSRALAAVTATESVTEGTTIDPVDMGLYMITASKPGYTFNPMVVYVGPDFDGVKVQAKGAEDQVKKEADAHSHAVASGDVVGYTITAEYPYYPANATNKEFVISDAIENAKFNPNSISVTINGSPATVGKDYTAPAFTDDNTKMSIQFNYNLAHAGEEVKVTYKATVDDITGDAEIKVKNEAKAETDGKYTIAEVVSDSATFTITKVDSTDEEKLLPGAEFTLYVADNNGGKTITYKNQEIKVNVVETKATVDEDDLTTKNFTETKGTVTFFGLDPEKDYYVEETKAPEGYSKLNEIWKLDGASQTMSAPISTTKEDSSGQEYTLLTTTTTVTDYTPLKVENTTLSSLPSTGGIGTTIFTIGGCVIMVTAAGLYFATRKKSEK